ncbi:LysR family transcriptional regulator [Leeia oryzae]|uniref:LysR family transcriptional regulator n=1 Tax=Leeia oryzae TaxID=356662 RepID=UPI00035D6C38|nr:LysR family transcriptional regulator [Leeia oryzae]
MIATDTLQIFVTVVHEGSFTAAADRLNLTPSGISRSISRLEKQLGVRLITRTTRRLDLTEEGQWFLQRANDILNRLTETTLTLQSTARQPSGLVRINAATPVLNHLITPILPVFRQRYPDIRLELVGEEAIIDLIEERADVAIRVGPLEDSTLNARLLFENRLRLVASPDYLKRCGTPVMVEDLQQHQLLGFTKPASLNIWPLAHQGNAGYTVTPDIASSNGETIRFMALSGSGIACLSDFLVREDVRQGRLVDVLADIRLPWMQPVWAVFYRQGFLAPRISHFIDFLAAHLKPTFAG